MTEQFPISTFDIFFLSYDEPNAEKHWADLIDKCPWAKRVHGVKGFDAAHRTCAQQSETDWFVTVDADNIVDPSFFDIMVDIDPVKDLNKSFCWNGTNMINGLMYGNGGLKLWSKKFAGSMASHEMSENALEVDFCWTADYQVVQQAFSEVWNNGSPYQAFRVGFREGVKLALDRGQRIKPELMKTKLHPANLRNLKIWSSVGSDIDNGLWAIYGARLGWSKVCDMNWDHTVINDYEWFNKFWEEVKQPIYFERTNNSLRKENHALFFVEEETKKLGAWLKETTKINIPNLDADSSEFFRDTFKLRNV